MTVLFVRSDADWNTRGVFTDSIANLVENLRDRGHRRGLDYDFGCSRGGSIQLARSRLAKMFLVDPRKFDHFVLLDNDLKFRAEDVVRLIELEATLSLGVVVGHYAKRAIDWTRVALAARGQRPTASGPLVEDAAHFAYVASPGGFTPCVPLRRHPRDPKLVAVLRGGGGFLCVSRNVMTTVWNAYAATKGFRDDDGTLCVKVFDESFGLGPVERRRYHTEDETFFLRVRKLGGDVWLDTRCQMEHVGPWTFPSTELGEMEIRPPVVDWAKLSPAIIDTLAPHERDALRAANESPSSVAIAPQAIAYELARLKDADHLALTREMLSDETEAI